MYGRGLMRSAFEKGNGAERFERRKEYSPPAPPGFEGNFCWSELCAPH